MWVEMDDVAVVENVVGLEMEKYVVVVGVVDVVVVDWNDVDKDWVYVLVVVPVKVLDMGLVQVLECFVGVDCGCLLFLDLGYHYGDLNCFLYCDIQYCTYYSTLLPGA
jgi:hypothetical protein